jgi:hypothetical protein
LHVTQKDTGLAIENFINALTFTDLPDTQEKLMRLTTEK